MNETHAGKLADCFASVYPGLVLYARQWLSAAGAEDAAQEAFVRLMSQPHPPANLKAWLYLTTQRVALDSARANRRRLWRESAVAAETPLFASSPAERIDAAEAEAALQSLSQEFREVLILRIWGGLTLTEIAEITDAAIST